MATLIPKEALAQLHFIPAEVDKSQQWSKDLTYAVRLGNSYKGKTNIAFVTQEGFFEVQTTIWAVTEDTLSIKGGINIPLKSIINIHF